LARSSALTENITVPAAVAEGHFVEVGIGAATGVHPQSWTASAALSQGPSGMNRVEKRAEDYLGLKRTKRPSNGTAIALATSCSTDP
jgi:hypothetical protein